MGVDTKGVIATNCKDVMRVCSIVERALEKLVNDERKLRFPGVWVGNDAVRKLFTTPTTTIRPESEMAQIHFKFAGEARTLTLHFGCDSDHTFLVPKTLSMSMGCSGLSDLFVKTVLHALSLLGPAYFDHNDCDDLDLALLAEFRPTLMQAVNLGYIRDVNVEDWVDFYAKSPYLGSPDKKGRESFFGVKDSALQKVLAIEDHGERWKAVSNLAATVHTPSPSFQEEFQEEMVHRDAKGPVEMAEA